MCARVVIIVSVSSTFFKITCLRVTHVLETTARSTKRKTRCGGSPAQSSHARIATSLHQTTKLRRGFMFGGLFSSLISARVGVFSPPLSLVLSCSQTQRSCCQHQQTHTQHEQQHHKTHHNTPHIHQENNTHKNKNNLHVSGNENLTKVNEHHWVCNNTYP